MNQQNSIYGGSEEKMVSGLKSSDKMSILTTNFKTATATANNFSMKHISDLILPQSSVDEQKSQSPIRAQTADT